MKPRTRRNYNKGNEEQDGADADDTSSYSGSPVKEKENVSPGKGRLSCESYQEKFEALLKDFDNQVKLNKNDIFNNIMLARDTLTLPFKNAVMKMPAAVRNMEWGEYLRMRANASNGASVLDSGKNATAKLNGASNQTDHQFAVPTCTKMETPAVRTSSRIAKGKVPSVTPKFDPKTPASALPKRLPMPGEILMSLSGSPVAVPASSSSSSSMRENRAAETSDAVLYSLLKNPDTFSSALRNKETRAAFVAAYNASLDKK